MSTESVAITADLDRSLLQAMEGGTSWPLIKTLIGGGANVNMVNKDGNTLFHLAVEREDVKLILFLLNHPDLDKDLINKKNNQGHTPLSLMFGFSSNKFNTALGRLILENSNPALIYENNKSILHFAFDKYIFLNNGTIELLNEYQTDLNLKDDKGNTPLHYCAIKRAWHKDIINLIILGGDPFILNNQGQRAVDVAVEGSLLSKLLLTTPSKDQTINELDYIRNNFFGGYIPQFFLNKILSFPIYPIVKECIQTYSQNKHQLPKALYKSIEMGSLPLTRLLLNEIEDINHPSYVICNKTPLNHAIWQGNRPEIIAALLAKGIDSSEFYSALSFAMSLNRLEIVKLLILQPGILDAFDEKPNFTTKSTVLAHVAKSIQTNTDIKPGNVTYSRVRDKINYLKEEFYPEGMPATTEAFLIAQYQKIQHDFKALAKVAIDKQNFSIHTLFHHRAPSVNTLKAACVNTLK